MRTWKGGFFSLSRMKSVHLLDCMRRSVTRVCVELLNHLGGDPIGHSDRGARLNVLNRVDDDDEEKRCPYVTRRMATAIRCCLACSLVVSRESIRRNATIDIIE